MFNKLSKTGLSYIFSDKQELEKEERLKKLYYIAVKTRNFEITQLVQRNNFFMIFQGVLIASIIYSNNTVPLIHFAICFIGIFISFFQMQIAAGAKFWQEYWESEVNKAELRLKDFYENTKKTDDFHNLFKKDLIDVQNTLYKKFYKINNFKASKEYWDTNYNHGYKKIIKTYNPFTSVNDRILTKPSVSKIPISTARLLLITWSFLLITSTSIGENAYNYISGYKIFTGFPGKSIASIDIRNYEKSDRNDGFDDDKEKSE